MKLLENTKKIIHSRDFRKISFTVIGILFAAFGFKWFLLEAGLYSVDVTGLVQIFGKIFDDNGIAFNYSLAYYIASVPIFIFAYINYGARFTIYSMLSVAVFGIVLLTDTPSKITEEFAVFSQLERVIYGGIAIGFGMGLCLREGTSAGGFDVMFTKWSRSGKISFQTLNIGSNAVIILIIVGINNWEITAGIHTIVRVVITTVAIKFTNTTYNFVEMKVYSTKIEELSKVVTHEFGRGATVYKKTGAYTKIKGEMLQCMVVRQEWRVIRRRMLTIDPNVIIVTSRIDSITGNIGQVRTLPEELEARKNRKKIRKEIKNKA